MRIGHVAVALSVLFVMLAPLEAQAAFCSDKANGWWCSGSYLVVCQNGSQSSSELCQCGCKSMPDGYPDECKACGGFCSDKANGWWCNGEYLVVCQGGAQASSEKCQCGCKSMPDGYPDECKACGGFCSDKANGWWCDGEYLVVCQGGAQSSSEKCECGCKSMAEGEPDECKACGGFCSGKGDGWWCDGDWRVHCSGGQQTNSEQCAEGCAGSGGQAVCKEPPDPGFCGDKSNGWWCNGTLLVQCQGGAESSVTDCEFGCKSMPDGDPDECVEEDPPEGFCSDKSNGDWCDDANLVQCLNGSIKSTLSCEFGCVGKAQGEPDECAPNPDASFCSTVSDGTWCDGKNLVECKNGKELWSTLCEVECAGMPDGIPDVCQGEEGTFCQGKVGGYWCNGNLLTLCEGGVVSSSIACNNACLSLPDGQDDMCKPNTPGNPGGELLTVSQEGQCGAFSGDVDLWEGTGLTVWNQKDHDDDTLGTCDGLTIKSAGCLVTSLAMLYEFAGKYRTVGGKTGNSPPIEDAWRTKKVDGVTRGYAGTTYEIDGKTKTGDCLAYLDKNPSGISLQYHYNVSAGCIEYNAAVVIANSLNSGLPVLAGVHWVAGEEDQHWVLITGADASGVFFNDPWGGAANVRLGSGKLGSYTIDTFFTPYVAGMGGPDDDGIAFGENGQPMAMEEAVSRLPSILDDEGNPGITIPQEEEAEVGGKSGGCSAVVAPGHMAWLFVVALLALAAGAVLRSARRRRPEACGGDSRRKI